MAVRGRDIANYLTLDAFTPQGYILYTNSSSYKSSQMVSEVSEPTKRRILNIHYYIPPKAMVVEIMIDGSTEEAIFPFLVVRLKESAALPHVARKEIWVSSSTSSGQRSSGRF
jgi:3-hydroxyacyl-CoA dehydrogenase